MFPLSFGEYEDTKIFLKKPIDTNPQEELTSYILESGEVSAPVNPCGF